MAEMIEPSTELEIIESCSHQNGCKYWLAREFMVRLGYTSWDQFKRVINRAISSCASLELDVSEAFEPIKCETDPRLQDFKLSRFACFLIVMHADDKKPEVQRAKVALSALAETLVQATIDAQSVLRIDTRAELKSAEKVLSAVAKEAGVTSDQFGIFKDAGFRGMYNMSLAQLRAYKGVRSPNPKRPPVLYDFMGLTELAGNLFRDTQTVERIRSQNVRGLTAASESARTVGEEVRSMMIRNSGIKPEDLPVEEDIKHVKSRLKKASRTMIKHDTTKKKSNK